MNIGNTNMRQIQALKKPQGQQGGRGTMPEEKTAGGAGRATTTETSLTMKAKMVEVLLVVKKETQTGVATQAGVAERAKAQEPDLDLAALTYNGKPLSELNPQEAQSLIAEDGYFGVKKTAQRIADFVLSGGGDNLDRLKAGRDGVLQGFAEAEKAWGGKLPEISYQTLDRALELIDERIKELGGGSVIDVTA